MTLNRATTIAALCLLALAPARAAHASALRCETLPRLMRSYLQAHVSFNRIDSRIRSRAMDSYIRSIDPSKTLLLKSEADQLQADADRFFKEIGDGDCSSLMGLQARLHTRYQEAQQFVKTYLANEDFEIDRSVELVIDPEERDFPVTPEERDRLVSSLVHFQLSNIVANEEDFSAAKDRLAHRYDLMTRRSSEVDEEDIFSSFADAFARSLDPHSNYFSADAMEDFQIGMSLSLEGIGVALSSRDGYPVVEQIIPGGATDRVGALEPNDKIIAVAQPGEEPVSVVDMALRDVVRLIRGKKGTSVRLTVLRQEDVTKRFKVTIVRDTIDLREQAAKLHYETREVDGRSLKFGVIELRSFYGDRDPRKRRSSDDVKKYLKEASEAGVDGILLDLSKNGGGNLEYAVEISGFFVNAGGIVAIRESSGRSRVLHDPDDDIIYGGPLVVLTSRISASASEILAGALKDYHRAVIVGDAQTFGKGSVQTVVPLPPGLGALKVTTAMFFRPGGASTQMSGVAPHIRIPSPYDREEFGEQEQRYALPSRSMTPFLPDPSERGTHKLGSWKRLSPELIDQLSLRSQSRVDGSEEFAEVVAKVAEAKEKESVIRLADILEERQNGKPQAVGDAAIPSPLGPPEKKDEDEEEGLSLQVRESLQILTDLVTLAG